MGVIYRARQRHSRRIVALKRMLSFQADSQETLARFRREAEAAASLDHPNILPIYEVSEGEDGLPFFSMKFAPGGSLLDAAPALRNEPRRSVELMAKVARAVQYAHGHGILHRDLKPGNILLDGRGEPLVSDFGLAKWLDTTSDVTRTLTIFGTPGYIAPEQAKRSAAKLTPAADVYSLGALLFDLFTGRPPFLGEHALAVIQQASEKPAPKLRSLIPGFDRDLETICAKCLEREPNARYRSAGDLAEDLERWLEGRPIKTRRVLPSTHAWRWSRRNPALVGTAAVCLLLGAASLWLLREPDWRRQISAATKKLLLFRPRRWRHRAASLCIRWPWRCRFCRHRKRYAFERSIRFVRELDLDGIDDYVQFDLAHCSHSRRFLRCLLRARGLASGYPHGGYLTGVLRGAGLLCGLRPVAQFPDWRRLRIHPGLEHRYPVSERWVSPSLYSHGWQRTRLTLTGLCCPRSARSV